MREPSDKIGYNIIDIVYEHEPNGVGRNELVRLSGYAKDTIDYWLDRLRNFGFLIEYPKYPVCLTEDSKQKHSIKNLIIPQDPNSKKFKRIQQRKHFTKRELGKNYAEIIILILCLATFGNMKSIEYKKSKPGLIIVHNPIDSNQTYMYGTTNQLLPGIALSDLINKLPKKSIHSRYEKAVLPKYYTNYNNNELFGYLKLSKEIAQKSLKILSKDYNVLSPIIKDKTNGNEIRYQINDELLNEFVQQCILAFNSCVDPRLEYAFICEYLNDKQQNEYSEFLKKWYGLGRKYSNIDIYLKTSIERGINNSSKEHYRKYIYECDKDIFNYELFEPPVIEDEYDRHKVIIGKNYKINVGEKYKPLEQKYPLIVNTFFDMLFPQFLRKIWYDQKKHIQ